MEFTNKVVYQIYPKSFCDSDGDGIGDLRGITGKLPYLNELGIDYLWLTPVFLSPQRDNGYDIADYRRIDPMFGTMEDLEELIQVMNRYGIGLMLDMVFNHTSTAHEWFRRALAGEKKYQEYYIFKDGSPQQPPTNWKSKFGGSAWEYVPSLQKWYLHLFDVTQADLNWENPAVREELKEVIRFWKNKGVRGFRFDVVNLISKPEAFEDDTQGDGRRFYTDGRHVHEFLRELVHDTGIADMITVGEMSSTTLEDCLRYSSRTKEELSMVFNFHHLKIDYKNGDKWKLQEPDLQELQTLFQHWQMGMQAGGGWNAVFWCNHDQPRIVSRLGNDRQYWKESAKMLATCIHMLRGTPYIYQGEELGMTNAYFDRIEQYRDVESLNYYRILLESGLSEEEAIAILKVRSRDNSRTPMQWDASETVGFTSGTPWIEAPDYKREANVLAEQADEQSIWSYYKRLIRLRKELPVIAEGTIRFLWQNEPGMIAYERELAGDRLLVICNYQNKRLRLSWKEEKGACHGEWILDSYEKAPDVSGEALFLKPYEACVCYFREEGTKSC